MAAKKNETPEIGVDNAADTADKSVLVRMVRAGDVEPFQADVHHAEVSNYQQGGWIVESATVTE